MRNNIASNEKTSSSKVLFWAKFNAEINSALIFPIILTLLRLVFSKEAIIFLIYLLADKAKCLLKKNLAIILQYLAQHFWLPSNIFLVTIADIIQEPTCYFRKTARQSIISYFKFFL